jgi:hypothetical protein
LALTLAAPRPAAAQEKKADKAAAVFDDDEKTSGPKPAGKDAAKPKGETVSDRDKIGFTQENVAAQMTELEERMFRLSEALRGLEPENASRLRLALKFSREEQILDQMRETQKLLKDAQVGKAETEVKELLAKLEHLRDLLLAEDLDFQLKLARLRQTREALGQLDRVVKEERREVGWSRFAIEQRKVLEQLAAGRTDLESLARDQAAVIADTKALSHGADGPKDARAAVREREARLLKAATALSANPLFADQQPQHLRRAVDHLGEAVGLLEKPDADAAVEAEEGALAKVRDELNRLGEQTAQAERSIAPTEFTRRAGDQAKNRAATDTLAAVSARLGDAGVPLRKDLIRASDSMRSAEQSLARTEARPAADDQSAALDVLTRSRDELAGAVEKLLVELRSELQTKLIGELTEMHEAQAAVRETTQAQAPRVLQKSRTAAIAVTGLSKKEAELTQRTERLLGLVEETEFGIALPTTLRVLSREMHTIVDRLKAVDVSARTVALETRVEEDLLGLTQAVRRLPPNTPPAPGTPLPSDPRERERELNRMIAELKMVRMLQARLNDDTIDVDKARPTGSTLPSPLRRELETLEATQDEIRDSLAKIAERLDTDLDNMQ